MARKTKSKIVLNKRNLKAGVKGSLTRPLKKVVGRKGRLK